MRFPTAFAAFAALTFASTTALAAPLFTDSLAGRSDVIGDNLGTRDAEWTSLQKRADGQQPPRLAPAPPKPGPPQGQATSIGPSMATDGKLTPRSKAQSLRQGPGPEASSGGGRTRASSTTTHACVAGAAARCTCWTSGELGGGG
ncbi:hypothetical protein EIP91_009355 [Steccherinum ochraceum]|uniref:Uncharacterized protein n=1 Tax=Steccherinum ochraceum TaxID=92696 RepID=A0A4R0RRR4_9APHY|nr:hypothetical protein EIP91_009355 [Steccherinum ochraceum]